MQAKTDSRETRRILGHYPTGVCAVTAVSDSLPVAMVVGSFTSVSLDPLLVAFLPSRHSMTWPKIRASGAFCVNVLSARQRAVCVTLCSSAPNKFAEIDNRLAASRLPIVEGAVAWLDCQLHAVHEAGDHYIAVREVRQAHVESPDDPLTFLRGSYATAIPSDASQRDLLCSREMRPTTPTCDARALDSKYAPNSKERK